MTEPKALAERAPDVIPGVRRWVIAEDDRIGGYETDAHAVSGDRGVVLIDPLPLAEDDLEALGSVEAICLTAACHQRSAWRYRERFGAPVYAPAGTRPMEGEADATYGKDDVLPGGLRAVYTPGPENAHYSFLLEGEARVLFCSDLLTHYAGEDLDYVPLRFHDEPEATKRSVRALLDLDFSILCFDHGAPITDDPHAAIRELLERDG